MLSTTTTALSTTMPTASINPIRVSRFSDPPPKYTTPIVTSSENGMLAAISKVMRHSRKKR